MKRAGPVISLALTWDGARWPMRGLPPKARAFLAASSAPKAGAVTKLLRNDRVAELRVCWVPRLKGGSDVLADSFLTATGRRINFRATKTILFGDIVGVIYRK